MKGEGKSEEAIKAFKRGKELERQADALEICIRKNRRKVLYFGNVADAQDKVCCSATIALEENFPRWFFPCHP